MTYVDFYKKPAKSELTLLICKFLLKAGITILSGAGWGMIFFWIAKRGLGLMAVLLYPVTI